MNRETSVRSVCPQAGQVETDITKKKMERSSAQKSPVGLVLFWSGIAAVLVGVALGVLATMNLLGSSPNLFGLGGVELVVALLIVVGGCIGLIGHRLRGR